MALSIGGDWKYLLMLFYCLLFYCSFFSLKRSVTIWDCWSPPQLIKWWAGNRVAIPRKSYALTYAYKKSAIFHGKFALLPLQTSMRSSTKAFLVSWDEFAHEGSYDWRALICVRIIRKKCGLLQWSAVLRLNMERPRSSSNNWREVNWSFIQQCVLTLLFKFHFPEVNILTKHTLPWPGLYAVIRKRLRTPSHRNVLLSRWSFDHMLETGICILRTSSTGLDHSGIQHLNCLLFFISLKTSRYKFWTSNLFDVNTGHAQSAEESVRPHMGISKATLYRGGQYLPRNLSIQSCLRKLPHNPTDIFLLGHFFDQLSATSFRIFYKELFTDSKSVSL
jgi:hypothetical protein